MDGCEAIDQVLHSNNRQGNRISGPSYAFIGAGCLAFTLLVASLIPSKPALAPSTIVLDALAALETTKFPQFIDKTIELGFSTEHRQRDDGISGLDQISGGGACVIDYDSDGWKDILIIGGSGIGHYFGKPKWWQAEAGNAIYRNVQGRYFELQENVLPGELTWGINCTAADFDNDGDQDLFIANKGPNQLFENTGGNFVEVPTDNFADMPLWTNAAAVADFDQDGLPDLYIVNYVDYSPSIRYLEVSSGYQGTHEALFKPELFQPLSNQLLRNTGNFHFEDITPGSGTADISGRGVAAQWLDIDENGFPDLLVSNDSQSPSKLFLNQGSGKFEDVSSRYGIASSNPQRTMYGAMSPTPNILVGGGAESTISLLELNSSNIEQSAVKELINTGGLSYLTESTQSIGAGDFNLDGIQDYYLANGLITPDMDGHANAQAQTNRLLLGQKGGSFLSCSELNESCFPHSVQPVSSRQVLVEDFDQDGDLDIFESANNDLGRYLENQTANSDKSLSNSKIEFGSDQFKLQIAKWLLEQLKFEAAVYELNLLAESESIAVATTALNLLGTVAESSALGPLSRTLRSEEPVIRKAAVLALRQQEVDYTGRYLIPLLGDTSEQVQCAVADSFSYFFDEEEAMVRSKLLATSELIRVVLNESSPQSCLIVALGKSESYRALQPLSDLVGSNDKEVKMAAIWALGLLKEQQAIPILARSANSQESLEAVAEVLRTLSNGNSQASTNNPFAYIQTSAELTVVEDINNSTLCSGNQITELEYKAANTEGKIAFRESLSSLSTQPESRASVLKAFLPHPLLSEYRIAQNIYADENDSMRFCTASVLLAYDPELHLDPLKTQLASPAVSEDEKWEISEAIYRYAPELIWSLLFKEEV